MKLTARQRYDYRDLDPYEAKLIRIGHAIWRLYKRDRAKSGYPVLATEHALATVWQAKKEYRAELKVKRAEDWAKRGYCIRKPAL
jgi:hypothetical protein